jgi:hypothetical protein
LRIYNDIIPLIVKPLKLLVRNRAKRTVARHNFAKSHDKFSDFEKKIKVVFKNKALLKQAFTHRSYINENPEPTLLAQ